LSIYWEYKDRDDASIKPSKLVVFWCRWSYHSELGISLFLVMVLGNKLSMHKENNIFCVKYAWTNIKKQLKLWNLNQMSAVRKTVKVVVICCPQSNHSQLWWALFSNNKGVPSSILKKATVNLCERLRSNCRH